MQHTSLRRRVTAFTMLTAIAALGLVAAGCSSRDRIAATANQPPKVEFDFAARPAMGGDGATHIAGWTGFDADGRVDHYRVAIDPRTLEDDDPAWVATTERRRAVLARPRVARGALHAAGAGAARDFTLIAVQAVDDRGAHSAPAYRAYFEDNIAPTVRITVPRPSALISQSVPPNFTVRWEGADPDAPGGRPAEYRYLLLGPGSAFPLDVALANPDSLRRFYAPSFAGWTSAPGTATGAELQDLEIGAQYVFAIVAIDAGGAYTPFFDLNTNMLRIRVGHPDLLGPRLSFRTSYFNYTATSGGIDRPEISIEIPAGVPFNPHWFAEPLAGRDVTGYRWALDPREKDLDKELKRPQAGNDLHHWRPWSLTLTSVTLGPFAAGEEHVLAIEAKDALDLRSRLMVRFRAVGAALTDELLIVDDTRLVPDQITGACTRLPVGAWPTAAELDSFLFARGGHPWRCYPAGTMSAPGLFAGYRFDTLGTRTGQVDLTVPLSTLSRYRHVIWIVDAKAALNNAPGSDPVAPMSALRYMSAPGRFNTLAAYAAGGGKVWLVGGGGATATLMPWNFPGNDAGGITFSNALPELVPGRLMYDLAHWRSEIRIATLPAFIQRDLGTNVPWPGAPSDAGLPVSMRGKTSALDPFPPGRAGQSPSTFYTGTYSVEFLSQPNAIAENGVSALDSLYGVITFSLPPAPHRRIAMTHYHGAENAPFIFSGFDIWSFTRSDCRALVDWVLRDAWGLAPTAPPEPLVNAVPRR